MKTLLIALLLAVPASASFRFAAEEGCEQKTITVCKVKPAPKKLVRKAKKPTEPKVEEPKVVAKPKAARHLQMQPIVIIVETPKCPPVVAAKAVEPIEENIVFGPRIAIGLGVRNEFDTWGHTSMLLGMRARFPKLHLGLDAYTSFAYGVVAAQALVYPVQGKNLNWQVGLGVLSTGDLLLTTADVPRTWDMTVGTGIEYKIAKNVSFTADWRVSLPNPVFMVNNSVPTTSGRYLDVPHVIGNSLVQSQVLVGLMLHN